MFAKNCLKIEKVKGMFKKKINLNKMKKENKNITKKEKLEQKDTSSRH